MPYPLVIRHRLRPSSGRRFAPRRALAMAALGVAVAPALAQTTPVRSAADVGVSTLQPVTVTGRADNVTEGSGSYQAPATTAANRLSTSLRETPQSVTVLTRQRLDDMGFTTIREALGQVTGIYATENDTERTRFVSRGYSIANFQVDGISLVQGDGYVSISPDPAVYDRVDVVRGATGLMTGAGDPSGSVSLQRKRPTRAFAASVGATLGRWDNRRVEADVGGPLAFDGRLRGRMVVVKQDAKSFRDRYSLDKKVFYGVLEADVTPHTVVSVGVDYQSPEASGVTWGTVPYWMADGSLANLPRNTSWAPPWARWTIEQKQAFARVEHRLANGWQLKAGYLHDLKAGSGKKWFGGSGYPAANGTGMSAWTGGGSGYDIITRAMDLSATGPFSLLGRDHELVVGFTNSRSREDQPFNIEEDLSAADLRIADWRTWDGNVREYDVFVADFTGFDKITRQRGTYAAARLSLADPVTAIVGARLSSWRTRTREWNADNQLTESSGYAVSNELTPYAGLVVDVTRDWSVYGSYTDIFKPQDRRDINNTFLAPVVGKNVEVGAKGELFEGRLNAAVALFRGKQDNIAERDESRDLLPGTFDPNRLPPGYDKSGHFELPGGALPYVSSGKGNTVRGAEIELQGQVTDRWNLAAGFTYTETKNAAGERIQGNQPIRLLRLFTTYRLPGDWQRLTVGGGLTWQSGIWSAANQPTGTYRQNGTPITARSRIEQGAVTLVNLMARYEFTDQLSASLHVNNVFDKKYFRNVGFYQGVHWGEPRNVLVSARYRF